MKIKAWYFLYIKKEEIMSNREKHKLRWFEQLYFQHGISSFRPKILMLCLNENSDLVIRLGQHSDSFYFQNTILTLYSLRLYIYIYIYRSTIFIFNWWWRRIAVYDFDTLWILGRVSFLHVRWNSLTQFHFKNNWLDSTNVIRKKKTIQWRILTIH